MAAGDIYLSKPSSDGTSCGCECSPFVCPDDVGEGCPEGTAPQTIEFDGHLCTICLAVTSDPAPPPVGTNCDCGNGFLFEGIVYLTKEYTWDHNGPGKRGVTHKITSIDSDCSESSVCWGSCTQTSIYELDGDVTITIYRMTVIDCSTFSTRTTTYRRHLYETTFTKISDVTDLGVGSLSCGDNPYILFSNPCSGEDCPPGYTDTIPTCPEGQEPASIAFLGGLFCYECVDIPTGPPGGGVCPDGYTDTMPTCDAPNVLETAEGTDGTCYKCIPPGDHGNPGGIGDDGEGDTEPHNGTCPGTSQHQITVVFSGITACCIFGSSSSSHALASSLMALNSAFTLTRSGAAYIGNGPSWGVELFNDTTDCTGTVTPSAGVHATTIELVCTGSGNWQVLFKDRFDSIVIFQGTSVSPVSSTIPACATAPFSDQYFTGGIATIEW